MDDEESVVSNSVISTKQQQQSFSIKQSNHFSPMHGRDKESFSAVHGRQNPGFQSVELQDRSMVVSPKRPKPVTTEKPENLPYLHFQGMWHLFYCIIN